MKSPAMHEVLKPLARMEIEARAEYAKQVAEFEADALIKEATKKVRKSDLAKTIKDGGDGKAIADSMIEKDDQGPPVRKRYKVNDATVEKLGVILKENPNGVLVEMDELVSLLRTMDREGHEGDRGFYLMAWDGGRGYTYDRIGRGTVDIDAAIVSIVGSIQPGPLQEYLREAVRGGRGNDGLMQRLQLAVWPDPNPLWENIDRYPNTDAREKAYNAFNRLDKLTAGDVNAQRDDFERLLPFLRFADDAQELFDQWRWGLENSLRDGADHDAIVAHRAKYRSLIPSLALIDHLLNGGTGPVPLASFERAIYWGTYLESHARRLYASVTNAPAVAARLLAAKIEAGDVKDLFASRDVYRNGWTGLDREETQIAIDVLVSLHWLDERTEDTAGRRKTIYAINPKIRVSPKGQLTEPTNGPSVSSGSPWIEEIPES
jgi:putative DNA primase/helicase